ncbi:unnamed protein product [Prunus brigantina]
MLLRYLHIMDKQIIKEEKKSITKFNQQIINPKFQQIK